MTRRCWQLTETEMVPPAFRAMLRRDTPEIVAAWDRYQQDRNEADFNALLLFYLPMTFQMALRLKRRRPEFYRDEVDALASDGVMGLMRGIRAVNLYCPGNTHRYLRCCIAGDIRKQTQSRSWQGARAMERMPVIERERAALTQELGRVPDRFEMAERIAKSINNPHLYVDAPNFSFFGEDKEGRREATTVVDDKFPAPDQRAISDEAVRLAMKHLGRDERKMLRMILAGESAAAIGRALGAASPFAAYHRVNGLLWELRRRGDLAASLGVEAWVGDVPKRVRTKVSIQSVPPARLAM